MAIVQGINQKTIRRFAGLIDFYCYKKMWLARSWPRPRTLPLTSGESAARAAFAQSRADLALMSDQVLAAYRAQYTGLGKAWLDYYTEQYMTYYGLYGEAPPILIDYSIKQNSPTKTFTVVFSKPCTSYAAFYAVSKVVYTVTGKKSGGIVGCGCRPTPVPIKIEPILPGGTTFKYESPVNNAFITQRQGQAMSFVSAAAAQETAWNNLYSVGYGFEWPYGYSDEYLNLVIFNMPPMKMYFAMVKQSIARTITSAEQWYALYPERNPDVLRYTIPTSASTEIGGNFQEGASGDRVTPTVGEFIYDVPFREEFIYTEYGDKRWQVYLGSDPGASGPRYYRDTQGQTGYHMLWDYQATLKAGFYGGSGDSCTYLPSSDIAGAEYICLVNEDGILFPAPMIPAAFDTA